MIDLMEKDLNGILDQLTQEQLEIATIVLKHKDFYHIKRYIESKGYGRYRGSWGSPSDLDMRDFNIVNGLLDKHRLKSYLNGH